MEYNEFVEQTQRLCDLYNKTLNESQAEFWYISLRPFDAILYRQAIGEYAKKNKYMPTISDLLSEIKSIKNKMPEGKQEEWKPIPCEKCHGTGLVPYVKQGYDYLCICNCKNGDRLDYPQLRKFDEVFPHVENSFSFSTPRTSTTPTTFQPVEPYLDYDTSQINF